MHDVVIVGAGLAGLSAARRLEEDGFDVLVLEARGRVAGRNEGGRLSNGVSVELGGQWVGPAQDAVLKLIEELGLRTFQVHDQGRSLLRLDGTVRAARDDAFGLPSSSAQEFGRVLGAIDALTGTVDLDRPWATPEAEALDRLTLDEWLRSITGDPLVQRFYEVMLATVFAADAPEISLLHFLFYLRSGGGLHRLMTTIGGAQDSRVVGGSHQISEGLAAQLRRPVVLDTPVRSVVQDDRSVTVSHSGGSARARHVVVALPPALAGRLSYDPPMPANRDSLTQQIPAGAVIKYQVGYDVPFWREQDLSGTVLNLDSAVGLVYDNCPPDASCGVLVAFVEGHHARLFNDLPPERRRQKVVAELVSFFGSDAAEPFDVLERNWSEEPYTRGCYGGHLGAGLWTQLGPHLSRPVGRIHWASAENASVWNGYMDGAIRSGRSAAEQVLRARAEEELGRKTPVPAP